MSTCYRQICNKTNNFDKTFAVLEQMEEVRVVTVFKRRHKPDAVTFGLALSAAVEGGHLAQLPSVLAIMQKVHDRRFVAVETPLGSFNVSSHPPPAPPVPPWLLGPPLFRTGSGRWKTRRQSW